MATKAPRDICDVLEAILKVVPATAEAPEWGPLRAALKRIESDAAYTAPELRKAGALWHRTLDALTCWIGEPQTAWQREVQRIFSGRITT